MAPKALIVETPAADEVKCSRISAVGPASARLTVDRALMYPLPTCAHQIRRAKVKKLVYLDVYSLERVSGLHWFLAKEKLTQH